MPWTFANWVCSWEIQLNVYLLWKKSPELFNPNQLEKKFLNFELTVTPVVQLWMREPGTSLNRHIQVVIGEAPLALSSRNHLKRHQLQEAEDEGFPHRHCITLAVSLNWGI